jgi:DNA polymerase III delta prime subunit
MTEKGEPTLAERIEAVEQAYEFMLAYAAQGREDEGGSVRQFLERAAAALDGLSTAATASPQPRDTTSSEAFGAFLEILDDDARKARAALQLVLAQKSIRSQLVDNLNASIHLRALLTDIFLIDEALKSGKD